VARALGHPLLSVRTRVANDVTVGPAGTALLISGSNMAGKSTLLRAIGLNAVLALAGAPVCAAELICPPMRLRTSIQLRDSLERGLSYFMAEVVRLREIVTAAEDSGHAADGPVLYLIDEMLSGTNSEERAVAIRLIVERLLMGRAIGVITTHDLPAFCVDPIQSRLVHAHFRERVTGAAGHETMDFDYCLYDGPATSRNALRLLALAGLVPA
jgi:Mismatch repair ATPase (MutS family)